ncbi:MAG: hypothetical protein EBT03_06250 [Betaproteobacteria bacterium]|nr:hypothetical protein [Betaproteobacteria bacterium]NBT74427.1 hypothetical protein [Betaproteobacteria bacterium]
MSDSAYLRLSNGDWSDCLHDSLRFLRHAWSHEWPGLPALLDRCAAFLGLEGAEGETRSLLAAAHAAAAQIELEEGRSPGGDEPGYHNRLHFADTLTCLTLQTALEARLHRGDARWQAALLLIAVGHDMRHPGRNNLHTSDIESLSVEALMPFMQEQNISAEWIDRVSTVILRSDFALVRENHERVNGHPFTWNTDWASVLLNEADIMASLSETFGPPLSLSLAKEWEIADFPAHRWVATPEGRWKFINSVRLTSQSSRILGAQETLQAQLDAGPSPN